MHSVLPTCSDNLLFTKPLIEAKSEPSTSASTLGSLSLAMITLSSALNRSFFRTESSMSLLYHKFNNGPNRLPLGTPHVILIPSTQKSCLRLNRYDRNRPELMPIVSSFITKNVMDDTVERLLDVPQNHTNKIALRNLVLDNIN